ncbi:MAG: hypothetical protein KAR47_17135, partial [Planctomycetes bacterium]|nr:hypothetical protein [Planctomycetota bacterium]
FGTDPNNLPLVSTQANNIYDPGGLDEDKVYYWRVDTVTSTETVTGDEWSFALVVPEVPTETAVFYPI